MIINWFFGALWIAAVVFIVYIIWSDLHDND